MLRIGAAGCGGRGLDDEVWDKSSYLRIKIVELNLKFTLDALNGMDGFKVTVDLILHGRSHLW